MNSTDRIHDLRALVWTLRDSNCAFQNSKLNFGNSNLNAADHAFYFGNSSRTRRIANAIREIENVLSEIASMVREIENMICEIESMLREIQFAICDAQVMKSRSSGSLRRRESAICERACAIRQILSGYSNKLSTSIRSETVHRPSLDRAVYRREKLHVPSPDRDSDSCLARSAGATHRDSHQCAQDFGRRP